MFNLNLYQEKLTTGFIGQSIQYYPKLDSTNTKAWNLISENAVIGTVVVTDNQTIGRGRQSNKWISTQGKSLTFSIVLYPNAPPNRINLYSLLAGLAITDCLIENNINAQLKWPNDILINKKKVGGILCESKISGRVIKSMVIGIGLNINEDIEDFSISLRKIATSLMIESKEQYQLEIILASILNHLENRLKSKESKSQLLDWEKRCTHLNQQVTFRNGNNIVEGLFNGLSSTGQAIIIINDDELKFDSGEII